MPETSLTARATGSQLRVLLTDEGLNMAGLIVVIGFFTLPLALPEYTVSPANLVTARPTDRPALPADGRAAITCRKTGTE